MNYKFISVLVMVSLSAIFSSAQNVYEVASDGRRIQLDGFLLEWKSDASRPFGKSGEWGCDAVKTVEGLSGYCKSKVPLSCENWKFVFLSGKSDDKKIEMYFNSASDTIKSPYYQYDRELYVSSGKLVTEWVIPWSLLETDSSGFYKLDIKVVNSCGDSLPVLTIRGNKILSDTKSSWSGTAIRALLIAILTMVFILMRRKLRKRTNQKV